MKEENIIKLLKDVKENRLDISEAVTTLKELPFTDIDFAKIDNHRQLRQGFPEVIFCEGKSLEQIKSIFKTMIKRDKNIMATRASMEVYESLKDEIADLQYHSEARIIVARREKIKISEKKILIVTGGTSDIPVAEEAAVTAEVLGNSVEKIYDVGVAGLHRLLSKVDRINNASVIIVIAGMEGALASVVGGIVDKPVVAVPTSVGYGSNFGGLAALLAMLNSCATGISVVNIDNGFGAACHASKIIKAIEGNQ